MRRQSYADRAIVFRRAIEGLLISWSANKQNRSVRSPLQSREGVEPVGERPRDVGERSAATQLAVGYALSAKKPFRFRASQIFTVA
jgi:hypothetical protein